jgi:hypothetical protein
MFNHEDTGPTSGILSSCLTALPHLDGHAGGGSPGRHPDAPACGYPRCSWGVWGEVKMAIKSHLLPRNLPAQAAFCARACPRTQRPSDGPDRRIVADGHASANMLVVRRVPWGIRRWPVRIAAWPTLWTMSCFERAWLGNLPFDFTSWIAGHAVRCHLTRLAARREFAERLAGSFRPPNGTGLLTPRGLLTRDSESFGPKF